MEEQKPVATWQRRGEVAHLLGWGDITVGHDAVRGRATLTRTCLVCNSATDQPSQRVGRAFDKAHYVLVSALPDKGDYEVIYEANGVSASKARLEPRGCLAQTCRNYLFQFRNLRS